MVSSAYIEMDKGTNHLVFNLKLHIGIENYRGYVYY